MGNKFEWREKLKGIDDSQEQMDPNILYLRALRSLMHDRVPADLLPELPIEPEQRLLYEDLIEIRRFALALANGDLSADLKAKGYLAGALKTLQANLRHVTWQTQRIAEGDYSQKVDFLGDFSTAFNRMKDQLAEANRKLVHKASTDGLTGLLNHAALLERLQMEIERSRRYGQLLSVVMMDIDFFKNVNDRYGHQAGDLVLAETARIIAGSIRSSDFAGRYGGEEFLAVMANSDEKAARTVAERIRQSLESAECTPDKIRVTLSGGVAEFAGDSAEELIGRADHALYEAKRNGRNVII